MICLHCGAEKPPSAFERQRRKCRRCRRVDIRRRHAANPEHMRSRNRRIYALNPKSILAYGRKYRQSHRDKEIARGRSYWNRNIPRLLLTQARRRATRLSLPFDLKIQDIIVPIYCPFLGIELQRGLGKPIATSPTLDRINSKLGYVQGNIQVLSFKANAMKQDATLEEFERMYFAWKTQMGAS